MKTFNELTKKELAELSEMQVEAYIDIELANKKIVKPTNKVVDYPNYLSVGDKLPERDMKLYEVDGYSFVDMETAQNFAAQISKLPTVQTSYDWNIDSSVKFAKEQKYQTYTVNVVPVYSEAKFEAVKEELKAIFKKKNRHEDDNDKVVDSVIDYAAVDEVKYQIRSAARKAIDFFSEAQAIATSYPKYLSITNDSATALKTLYTVYNVTDEEMQTEIKSILAL